MIFAKTKNVACQQLNAFRYYVHELKCDLMNPFVNLSRPDPGRGEKNNLRFLFSRFFVVPQKVKAFIKSFEVPQRSVKIKI